jgi:hypothetical protein
LKIVKAALVLILAVACASTVSIGRLTPTPTLPANGNGYLEGHATIGPLTPVERVDVPPPTPSPQLCMSVGIAILSEDGTKEVSSLNLRGDCTYRVELKPGSYTVRLKTTIGLPISRDLPKAVKIESGKTSRLNFDVDTGIR